MVYTLSEESDQPGHGKLDQVFAVYSLDSYKGPRLSPCGQGRLIRLG